MKKQTNAVEVKKIVIPVLVDRSEVDSLIQKASRLNELLKEANSLAKELASYGLLKIDVEI